MRVDQLEDRLVPSGNSVISGLAFQDATGNGMSADDTALAGVAIHLYQDTNHDGKLDTGDTLLATKTTVADGSYSFSNLNAGTYFVSESTPSGFVRTAPTVATSLTVNLADNQQLGGFNFDNYKTPSAGLITNVSFTITDPILGTYTVTNLRGQTHQGDTVQANFTVTGTSPVLVSLVTYDAPGATFNANTASQQVIVDEQSALLSPGPNSLTVHLPDNFYQVDMVSGAAIDQLGPSGSNIFYSAQSRLISADNEGTQAFVPAILSGVVYNDVNANGIYNSTTDVALPGVIVTVSGTNDLSQSVTLSTVTDSNGRYSFPQLRPGTYSITQSSAAQSGFANETSQEAFLLGGTASPGQIVGIAVGNGAVGSNYNLPQVQAGTASIGGFVFGNGVAQAGVLITLTGTDVNGNAVSITTTTGSDGSYTFGSLLAGSYAITETPASTFQGATYASSTSAVGQVNGGPIGTDGMAGTTAILGVTLGSGDVGTMYDFLNVYQSKSRPPA